MTDVSVLQVRIGETGPVLSVRGRVAWALLSLIRAGASGCTPLTHPGPRWAAYVLTLRRAGIDVETIDERHGPPYAGTHARYRLRTPVAIVGMVVRKVAE